MDLIKLKDHFRPSDIKWRIARCGTKNDGDIWALVFPYVTARAIQNRLDNVCGTMNWKNEFKLWKEASQLCGISIYNTDRKEWVTKWDGAPDTAFEAIKGGLSDSSKRAGYQWGIGRYLYELQESFTKTSPNRPTTGKWEFQAKSKTAPKFFWEIPDIPKEFLPKGYVGQHIPDDPLSDQNTVDMNKLSKLKELCSVNKKDSSKYNTAQSRQNYIDMKAAALKRHIEFDKFSDAFFIHCDSIIDEVNNIGVNAYISDMPF